MVGNRGHILIYSGLVVGNGFFWVLDGVAEWWYIFLVGGIVLSNPFGNTLQLICLGR